MDQKNQSNPQEEENIFNVEAQKEIVSYTAKVRTRESIKMILIVFPIIGIFVLTLLYIIFKFVGII